MVTKEQAVNASYRDEFHYGTCTRTVGPWGGITTKVVTVRVSGRCQTWKTRPDEFRLPVKYGLYESHAIDHRNARDWHAAADCPLIAQGDPIPEPLQSAAPRMPCGCPLDSGCDARHA